MGVSNCSVVRWLRRNVSDPLIATLERGADPNTLAVSGALGITLGIFPICGVTGLMCACAIGILGRRCNAPTMLLTNFFVAPLELSLVIPFLRFGEFIVNAKHLVLSKDSLWKAITGDASWEVLGGIYHAVLGWLVAAPFTILVPYLVLLPLMKFFVKRYGTEPNDSNEGQLAPLVKDGSIVRTV